MKQVLKKIAYQLPIGMQVSLHKMQHRLQILRGRMFLNQQINIFVSADKQADRDYIDGLKKDIKRCYVEYLAKPYEYFLLGFDRKNKTECEEILTDIVKDIYCCKYADIDKFCEVSDKFLFYERMKTYFKREACIVRNSADKEDFIAFTKRHSKFIAKPNGGSFGKDTNIYIVIDNADKLFAQLTKNDTKWIIEELIVQVPEMSLFNPSSVNSVRIPTFRTSKGIEVAGTFMRTGRKGSVVDNAGVGGIFVKVDEMTGKIISDGCTELGERFELHPDSNVKFEGFQIPKWNELVSIVIECHSKLPDHKYVGWDFALTDKGWVLMEGNWGQFLCQQVSSQKPLKKQFVSLIKG